MESEALAPRALSALRERALLVGAVALFHVGGYFAVARATDPARAGSLRTQLDELVPFLPESVFVYASVFAAAFLPVFVVRSRSLFRRVALAYGATIALSLACFVLVPVSSRELRASAEALDPSRFVEWGVLLIYRLDPATNLFPSLHLSIAVVAALSAWAVRPLYGAVSLLWVALVAVSVLTVKQHFAVDVLSGGALGAAAYVLFIRPGARHLEPDAAYGWRGPALFAGLVGLALACLYAAFRAGWGS
jgi:membrane-associated phospholipid phosphatase